MKASLPSPCSMLVRMPLTKGKTGRWLLLPSWSVPMFHGRKLPAGNTRAVAEKYHIARHAANEQAQQALDGAK